MRLSGWTVVLVLSTLSATTVPLEGQQLSTTTLPSAEDVSRAPEYDGAADPPPDYSNRGTRFKGAVEDSIRLLMIQHGVRIATQDKTRSELDGPFFIDYHRSVRVPPQWGDADSGLTNYVLHPGQGAASGFIWIQNSNDGQLPVSLSKRYMTSRLWATLWALGYSVQFEIGPLSEASIGNVGMRPETAGWVDYVMTPAGGLAIMMVEDALDRFVIQRLENRTSSPVVRAMLRMFLNPSRATANVAGMRSPWDRPGRPLSH
jgi:hypothetical protein